MQEIEAKQQLKASEGAHFFYNLIFLSASGIIQTQFIEQKCNQNLQLSVHLVLYGLIIWGTYILITLIPRQYAQIDINLFFNFLDICFGIYIVLLLFYWGKNILITQQLSNRSSSVIFFLRNIFVDQWYRFIILFLAFVSYKLKRFSKSSQVYDENKEEFYDA